MSSTAAAGWEAATHRHARVLLWMFCLCVAARIAVGETLVPMPNVAEFRELSLSTDAQRVAFVITRLKLGGVKTTDQLVVANTSDLQNSRVLATSDQIRNVRWDPVGANIYFLDSSYPTEVSEIGLSGDRRSVPFGYEIQEFDVSRGRDEIGALVAVPAKNGFLAATDGQPLSLPITGTSAASSMFTKAAVNAFETQLWLAGGTQPARPIPVDISQPDLSQSAALSEIDWSLTDSLRIVARGHTDQATTSMLTVTPGSVSEERQDYISPRERFLLVVHGSNASLSWHTHGAAADRVLVLRHPRSTVEVRINPTPISVEAAWSSGSTVWLQTLDSKGGALWEVNSTTGAKERAIEPPTGSFSRCTVQFPVILCVWEDLTTAPEIVRLNLETGRFLAATHLNSAQNLAPDIEFSKLQVVNSYKKKSFGYLAMPRSGLNKSIPICIMLYNFHETFSSRAQWIRNYPVEELVRSGIGVLLLNFSREDQDATDDEAASLQSRHVALLASPISTVLEAVKALSRRDVRPPRFGLMGWSWGGFVAAHISAQKGPFSAVAIGEPATWGPTAYSTGPRFFRDLLDVMIGGAPDSSHYSDYLDLTPGLRGDSPVVPTLIEASAGNLASVEYFTMFARDNPLVRSFIYPNVGHHFTDPEREELSHRRSLLWMRTYLLGNAITHAEMVNGGFAKPIPAPPGS